MSKKNIRSTKITQINNYGIPTKNSLQTNADVQDHALPSTSSVCLVHSFRGGKRYALQKSKIHNLFTRMGDESLRTQQTHQELKAFTCQFSLGHPSWQLLSFSWPIHSSWHSPMSMEPLFTLHPSPPYSDLKHAQARHRSYTPRHWLLSHLSTHHCTWREKAAATRLKKEMEWNP